MKTLYLFPLGGLFVAAVAAQTLRPTDVEIITPNAPLVFTPRTTTNTVVRGVETSRGTVIGVIAPGATRRTNLISIANPARTNSLLIGPIFPAPLTNLPPTGRTNGFGIGVGPVTAPLLTNELRGLFPTNRDPVTGLPVPASALPEPPPTPPLAPPTAPNTPVPATPTTPPATTPLAPPVGPTVPPTAPPPPPPAAPGAQP